MRASRATAPLLAALLIAAPAMAQDHAGHGGQSTQPAPAAERAACEAEAARHRAMGHPVPDGQCAPAAEAQEGGMDHSAMQGMDHGNMNHDAMDHGTMDRSTMNHAQMDHSGMGHPMPTPDTAGGATMQGMDHSAMQGMDHGAVDTGMPAIPFAPPPPEAGSGPPRAANAIWGADAMRASRDGLPAELGDTRYSWMQGDRVEYRARAGSDGYLWDVQGYYGGDLDKFWIKSEGEGSFGEEIDSAEVQALYSRAIGPWFDLQAGVRQDFAPRDRTYAVVGVQGIVPYKFEVDAAAFLSDRGDLTARIEGELDQRITQRLILQPRAEVSLAAQDVPELGIGAGLGSVEAGLRLRYEIAREFAPYIGVEQEWKLGGSRDYAHAAGEDASATNYVVGVRFWF